MPTFDEIIGIGGGCTPAYQIRRHFSVDLSLPFDWLLLKLPDIKPALEAEMRDEFDFDGLKKDLYCGTPMIFGKYAIHNHDLPQDVIMADDESWRARIPALRDRYNFLWRCLDEVARGDILFVRSYAHEDEYLRPRFPELFSQIMETLRRKFPSANITLLLVDYHLTEALDDKNIWSVDATSYAPHNMGCDRGWSEMFAKLDITRRERVA